MEKSGVTLETPVDLKRPPLVDHNRSLSWITDKVSDIVEQPTPKWWLLALCFTVPIALMGLVCII